MKYTIALLAAMVGLCSGADECVDLACAPNAESILLAGETCVCRCKDLWTNEPACTDCKDAAAKPPGCNTCLSENAINFPDCAECKTTQHCNSHATEAYRKTATSCGCKCSNKWEGDACQTCPPEYDADFDCNKCKVGKAFGDPNSKEGCTLCDATYCSGHVVQGEVPKLDGNYCNCQDVCRNRWEGATCNTCFEGFDESADCDQCLIGWIEGQPQGGNKNCDMCTKSSEGMTNCESVSSNRVKCQCSKCIAGYEGDTCESCLDGFVRGEGFTQTDPKCKQCSNADCNNHADRIESNAARTQCECKCSTGYEGDSCQYCIEGYYQDGTSCFKCTSETHCNNRAKTITSDKVTCQCKECRNMWTESDNCKTCPEYFAGGDCETCDATHIKYPACTEECTVKTHCMQGGTELAEHVVANSARTSCVCDCKDGFDGDNCENCAAGYKGTSPDCRKCSISLDCVEANTKSVSSVKSGNSFDCTCKCMTGYEGLKCESCKKGYTMQGNKCVKCTVDTHCNGHAVSASSDSNRKCTCNCDPKTKWFGDDCGSCAPQYEIVTGNCDRCLDGFSGYPTCEKCTIEQHCGGSVRATEVYTDDSRSNCKCKCKTGFDGVDSGCDKCAEGYSGFPNCKKCEVEEHCNGRATGIESDAARTKCVCICTAQYEGDKCDVCAAGYIGETPLPAAGTCTKCSNAEHCSGNAVGEPTDDGTRTKCSCDCVNYFMEENNCAVCNDTYSGDRCDSCANPAGILPSCNECNTKEHCSGNAQSVVNDGGSCKCSCRGNWNGDDCATCPGSFNPDIDCGECSDAMSCNNHGTAVVTANGCFCKGDSVCGNYSAPYDPAFPDAQACYCKDVNNVKTCPCGVYGCKFWGSCNGMWQGRNCDYCDTTRYRQDGDRCHECADGRVSYPRCYSCSEGDWADRWGCNAKRGTAAPAVGNQRCECNCKSGFEDPPNCGRCAYGWIEDNFFPDMPCRPCQQQDCSGNAAFIGSNANRTECVCTCKAGYDHGVLGQCSCCSAGYIDVNINTRDPADCTKCSIATHCNGNAISVHDDGNRTECACECYGQWEDKYNTTTQRVEKCGFCDRTRFGGADCDECAVGNVHYPYCYKCSPDSHCHGHAVTASSDPSGQECTCECSNNWGGAGGTCKTCPLPYSGADCNECDGGADINTFPDCQAQCTANKDCNNHAYSPVQVDTSVTPSVCKCDCRNKWTGDACDICPEQYGGADCELCGKDHFMKDGDCQSCTNEAFCNGRARKARATSEKCECEICEGMWGGEHCDECPADFGGVNCDTCAPGFTMFPECMACDDTMCHEGRSEFMTSDGDVCECACLPRFAGPQCNDCANSFDQTSDCQHCPMPFAGEYCDSCAVGYAQYPTCFACDKSACPNGLADSVTSDGTYCICICSSESCGGYGSCIMPHPNTNNAVVPTDPSSGDESRTVTFTLPTRTLTVTQVCQSVTAELDITLAPFEETSGPDVNGAASETGSDDGSSFPWWLLVLLGLFISSCFFAAFLLMRKKKDDDDHKDFHPDPDCSNDLMVPLGDIKKDEELGTDQNNVYAPDDDSMGSAPASDGMGGGDADSMGAPDEGVKDENLLGESDEDERMDV